MSRSVVHFHEYIGRALCGKRLLSVRREREKLIPIPAKPFKLKDRFILCDDCGKHSALGMLLLRSMRND